MLTFNIESKILCFTDDFVKEFKEYVLGFKEYKQEAKTEGKSFLTIQKEVKEKQKTFVTNFIKELQKNLGNEVEEVKFTNKALFNANHVSFNTDKSFTIPETILSNPLYTVRYVVREYFCKTTVSSFMEKKLKELSPDEKILKTNIMFGINPRNKTKPFQLKTINPFQWIYNLPYATNKFILNGEDFGNSVAEELFSKVKAATKDNKLIKWVKRAAERSEEKRRNFAEKFIVQLKSSKLGKAFLQNREAWLLTKLEKLNSEVAIAETITDATKKNKLINDIKLKAEKIVNKACIINLNLEKFQEIYANPATKLPNIDESWLKMQAFKGEIDSVQTAEFIKGKLKGEHARKAAQLLSEQGCKVVAKNIDYKIDDDVKKIIEKNSFLQQAIDVKETVDPGADPVYDTPPKINNLVDFFKQYKKKVAVLKK